MIIKSKPFKIMIRRNKIESISFSSPIVEILGIGEVMPLEINFVPADVIDRKLIYTSSNENVVKVSSDGDITSIALGEATITATTLDGSKSTSCVVRVLERFDSIKLDKNEHHLDNIGDSFKLNATLKGDNSTSRGNRNIVWSSNNKEVATVDENGVVTSTGYGVCTIYANYSSLSDLCSVRSGVIVNKIETEKDKIELSAIGQEEQIIAYAMPENASDRRLTYQTSNQKIATVNADGVVKAVGLGTCSIFISSTSNTYISRRVNVEVAIKPLSISITDKTEIKLKSVGDTKKLQAVVTPQEASQAVSWSTTNARVASVDSNGLVTAIGNGECYIKATDSEGHTDEVLVKVEIQETEIVIDKENIEFSAIGQTETITYEIKPTNAYNKTVTWTSSNGFVATVDRNGVVTAKSMGQATITAVTKNGLSTNCNVTVKIPCEAVVLDKTTISSRKLNEYHSIKPSALPSSITNPIFTYTSTNENVATVNKNGLIKTTGFGTANIKVAYDGKYAICVVTVTPIDVTGLELESTACRFDKIGQTYQIKSTVLPTDATYPELKYEVISENAGFTVDSNGLVTCTGILSGVIRVSSVENSNISKTFNVDIDSFQVATSGYTVAIESLRNAMHLANVKIGQVKLDKATTDMNAYMDTIRDSVNEELSQLDSSLDDIKNNVLEGIEDGVLTDIERSRIETSLDSLKKEKADVDAQYNSLYSNIYLVDTTTSKAKTNLYNAYNAYVSTYDSLMNQIDNLLLQEKINKTHISIFQTKMNNCLIYYKQLKTYIEKAIDSIAYTQSNKVLNDSKLYTDANLQVQSDRITAVVSSVDRVQGIVESSRSEIQMMSNRIESKVDANGVSSIIQQNPDSVMIGFNGISTGMTVSSGGLFLKKNGSTHTRLSNGRMEVVKLDGSSYLGTIGRGRWAGVDTEIIAIDTASDATIAFGNSNAMGVAYTAFDFQTSNTYMTRGLNLMIPLNMQNRAINNVGSLYTSEVQITSNGVVAPIIKATSQLTAEYIKSYGNVSIDGTLSSVGRISTNGSLFTGGGITSGGGLVASSQISTQSSIVATGVIKSNSQVQGDSGYFYSYVWAAKYNNLNTLSIPDNEGKMRSVNVETTCTDSYTPNTEYVGSATIVDGYARIDLPAVLYRLGAKYVIQITPIGGKDICVSQKNRDHFVVEGEDCEFDYIVKVLLPKSKARAKTARAKIVEEVNDINEHNLDEHNSVEIMEIVDNTSQEFGIEVEIN